MTTKTGSTEMTCEPKGPPFIAAIGGACLQLGTLSYSWYSWTSAGPCLASPLQCLSNPRAADPWGLVLICYFCLIALVWLASLRGLLKEGTADPSLVDRLWSLLPWLFCWTLFALDPRKPRLLVMTLLSTAWGVRLTYNFAIKGGFSGGEDYRWLIVRKWFPGWKFEVFNLIFICCFQLCTILAFATPAVTAMQSSAHLTMLDVLASILYLMFFIGETVADWQMWNFQTEKYRRKNAGESLGPYERGFIETGLWAYSRHPNYFCEVSMWWAFYLFSVSATGSWLNWTIWGAVFLTGLFVPPGASCDVTEAISMSKYPAYAEYQRQVSKFIPWLASISKSSNQESGGVNADTDPKMSGETMPGRSVVTTARKRTESPGPRK